VEWRKRGVVLDAPTHLPWSKSHAALPVAVPGADERVTVYFCTRDSEGRSQVARAHVDLERGTSDVDPDPVIVPGPAGTFDDSGATTSCFVERDGRQYLYYTGWTLGRTVPFRLAAGCAESDDGGRTFVKSSAGPVLPHDAIDPFATASPAVLIEDGLWRMWYVSGTGWRTKSGQLEPEYHIKYAESHDAVDWWRTGLVCIDYQDPAEHAIARPCVIRDADRYRMWFCARGDAYRLGYAESDDGRTWRRMDSEGGLNPSDADGWDSEMIAYPWVFDQGGRRWMLYNGNDYGRSGIGLAELRDQG